MYTKLMLELLEAKYTEQLDMGSQYRAFTDFTDQSRILTRYVKLLLL